MVCREDAQGRFTGAVDTLLKTLQVVGQFLFKVGPCIRIIGRQRRRMGEITQRPGDAPCLVRQNEPGKTISSALWPGDMETLGPERVI